MIIRPMKTKETLFAIQYILITLSGLAAILVAGGLATTNTHAGTVVAWGDNAWGQADVPAGLTNVMAVAAGMRHSLALKEDGTVMAWGGDDNGLTEVPAGLTNVIAIAAGGSNCLALKADGTVIVWGRNNFGPVHKPAGLKGTTTNVSLELPTQSGRVYLLEYDNSLTGTNWNGVALSPGNGTTQQLVDPTPTNTARFYRVRQW